MLKEVEESKLLASMMRVKKLDARGGDEPRKLVYGHDCISVRLPKMVRNEMNHVERVGCVDLGPTARFRCVRQFIRPLGCLARLLIASGIVNQSSNYS